ncbi:hypothetical protein BDQ17DRAFT_1547908 [Cyathus striatus]|nr:hypothetical protein BDQ17DRAFT_1547908 [Cyathus striatus]
MHIFTALLSFTYIPYVLKDLAIQGPAIPAVPANASDASDVSQYVYECAATDNTIDIVTYTFTSVTPLSEATLEDRLRDYRTEADLNATKALLDQERDTASEFGYASGTEGRSNTTTTHYTCSYSYYASENASQSSSSETIRAAILFIFIVVGGIMFFCGSLRPRDPAARKLEGAGAFMWMVCMLVNLPAIYCGFVGLVMAITYPSWIGDFVDVGRFK